MADALILFPIGAAIGRVDAAGNVYQSKEFSRALATLLERVGGSVGPSMDDLAIDMALEPAQAQADHEQLADDLATCRAQLAETRKALADLQAETFEAVGVLARLAEARKELADLQILLIDPQRPTDWEHPGKLGAAAPNSAKVTTLSASGQITSTVAGGTAPLVVASGTQVANLNVSQLIGKTWAAPAAIGNTTPASGAFTTLSATSGPISTPSSGNTGSFNTNGTNAVSVQFGGDEATGYTWQRNIQQNVGAVPHRVYCYNTLVATFSTVGLQVAAGFGCNGKTPQAAAASGGTLTGVIAALVANGILSS